MQGEQTNWTRERLDRRGRRALLVHRSVSFFLRQSLGYFWIRKVHQLLLFVPCLLSFTSLASYLPTTHWLLCWEKFPWNFQAEMQIISLLLGYWLLLLYCMLKGPSSARRSFHISSRKRKPSSLLVTRPAFDGGLLLPYTIYMMPIYLT